MGTLITAVTNFTAALGLVFSGLPAVNTTTHEICVTVKNTNPYDVNVAWVAYKINPGSNYQDLIQVFPFTVAAGATRELCVPAFPCGQFDFVQWDLILPGAAQLPDPYHVPDPYPVPNPGAIVTACPPDVEGTCRMTGGINLSTDAANLGNGHSTSLSAVGGGFQLRSPSRGTSNLELHLTFGGQTYNIKMDMNLTEFDCDDATQTITAVAGATVNGDSGYELTVILTDNGEPGRDDTVTLLLTHNGAPVVWFTEQALNLGGNLQFHAK